MTELSGLGDGRGEDAAGDDQYERSPDGAVILPPGIRTHVDALLEEMRGGASSGTALNVVGAWIESEADALVFEEGPQAFLALHESDVTDDAIRRGLELEDDEEVTPDHRTRFLSDHDYMSGLWEDADVSVSFNPITCLATDGTPVIIASGRSGYSFSGVSTSWYGPFDSAESCRRSLVDRGWIMYD